MANVLIVHGTEGSPNINWFPWLKSELEKLGCQVNVPAFPTPSNQSLDNWWNVIRNYSNNLDEDSIMIGHSLGPSFILSVLERIGKPIKCAFLIAGFTGSLGNARYDSLNKSIADKEFNWEKIMKNCKKFYVLNSDNDPYVPLEKGKALAKNLGTDVIVVPNAGHINAESGHTKFELLLDLIKKEI